MRLSFNFALRYEFNGGPSTRIVTVEISKTHVILESVSFLLWQMFNLFRVNHKYK